MCLMNVLLVSLLSLTVDYMSAQTHTIQLGLYQIATFKYLAEDLLFGRMRIEYE